MPLGFKEFDSGCPGLASLGFVFDESGCEPNACTDLTFRGQQILINTLAFDQANTFGGGNLRTSWGYLRNGELWSLIGQANCAGGNMAYTAECVQINHYVDDVSTLDSGAAPSVPDPFAPFSNAVVGTSDVPVWVGNSNAYGGIRVYYDNGTSYVEYFTPGVNGGGHNIATFLIDGDDVWTINSGGMDSGPPYVELSRFDKTTGIKLNAFYPFDNDAVVVSNLQCTTDYLYCVGLYASRRKVYKIDRATGALISYLEVTALAATVVAVADDSLIYLFSPGGTAAVYYIKNFSEIVFIGEIGGIGFNDFGSGTAIWNNGTLYFGGSGTSGFSTDVRKVPIACPDDLDSPILASVLTDATVVAGAAIDVDWANVLQPQATDSIEIYAEQAAGVIGWALGETSEVSTPIGAATTNGTVSVTIPGGTTPGNYVAMYVTVNGKWVATSAPFTVT